MECLLVSTYCLESTLGIIPCMSWEFDRIGVAPVEALPLSNFRHCYPTVLLAEYSPLGLAEVAQEILPLAWSSVDSFHYIGYKADNHSFVVVGMRDCRLFLSMTLHGFLPLFF